MRFGVPPLGTDVREWISDIRRWLARNWDALSYRDPASVASQDGLIMWDTAGYPVVSKGGEWREIVLADGFLNAAVTSDVIAAAPNTAYPITWSISQADGFTVSGDEITFGEAGLYSVSFSAQVASVSSSTVTFWFWPRKNGVDTPNTSIIIAVHRNNAVNQISRTRILSFAAGDVLQAMWAVSDVNGFLSEQPATAFAPETPAVTISIARVHS